MQQIDEALESLLRQLNLKRTDGKITILEPSTMRLLAAVNAAAARNHIATDYNPLHQEKKK